MHSFITQFIHLSIYLLIYYLSVCPLYDRLSVRTTLGDTPTPSLVAEDSTTFSIQFNSSGETPNTRAYSSPRGSSTRKMELRSDSTRSTASSCNVTILSQYCIYHKYLLQWSVIICPHQKYLIVVLYEDRRIAIKGNVLI